MPLAGGSPFALVGRTARCRRLTRNPPKPSTPRTSAGIYFTGGTTGRPKGVMLSHRAWVHTCYAELLDFDVGWREVFIFTTPMTHAAGCLLLPVLLRQGRCVLLERFTPDGFLAAVARERAPPPRWSCRPSSTRLLDLPGPRALRPLEPAEYSLRRRADGPRANARGAGGVRADLHAVLRPDGGADGADGIAAGGAPGGRSRAREFAKCFPRPAGRLFRPACGSWTRRAAMCRRASRARLSCRRPT
jgi:hypothetical protein